MLELSLALGCTCALPFFNAEKKTYGARVLNHLATDIVIGKFGVREPAASCAEISLNTFDLVLVPGVAFDLDGNRLGRGKGFYDRLLKEVSGIKCGLSYDFQLLGKFRQNHTMPRWTLFSRRRGACGGSVSDVGCPSRPSRLPILAACSRDERRRCQIRRRSNRPGR